MHAQGVVRATKGSTAAPERSCRDSKPLPQLSGLLATAWLLSSALL